MFFLPAHHAAPSQLDQDRAHIDAAARRGAFGVPQEAGIDAGIAERQRFPVDPDRTVHQRAHQLLAGVLQGEQIGAVPEPFALQNGDQRLDRRVAGAGTHAAQRRVDAGGALVQGDKAVGHRNRQVFMRVDADFRRRIECIAIGPDPLGDARHRQRAAGIGHIDAMGAVALHQSRLGRKIAGCRHVRHHQEARDIHVERPGGLDMLSGDVGFRAVGGDAHRAHPEAGCLAQMVDRSDTGQQKRRQFRPLAGGGRRLDPCPVAIRAETVIQRRTGKPVAMRDLDRIDPGRIERGDDLGHAVRRDLVANGMHAVAQRHVLQVDCLHDLFSAAPIRRSAVCRAADVMMSRFPA